ncbi:MAG: FAD/NAD(P)-binding oxidoreductase [archaeon]|nr:FAD/NAD(P)-binding oxidoreductase [archaeon]
MVKRIGIVGSGDGGTLTANLLAAKLSAQIKQDQVSIELFGKDEAHVFQPGNLDVAFKGASPEQFVKEESTLLKPGVRFIAEPVTRINLADREIALLSGGKRSFDYLILATGSESFPEGIDGLTKEGLFFHKGPFDSRKIWLALQNFQGGNILIAITGVPHKCPPSPNEAAFLVDEYLRKRGIRDKANIKFLTPYPRAYPSSEIAKTVQEEFDKRGIEIASFFNADSVDPKNKTISSLEGDTFSYDLLLAVPPHRGAKVIRDSEIGSDKDEWIPTDKRRLNVKNYNNVYAIGDATDIPTSKSGVVAHLESVLLSKNLTREVIGREEDQEVYNGRINCPMEMGRRRAIFVSATYSEPPKYQSPSFVKYEMKRAFGRLYWSAMKGSWEWLFRLYFGKTSTKLESEEILIKPSKSEPLIAK